MNYRIYLFIWIVGLGSLTNNALLANGWLSPVMPMLADTIVTYDTLLVNEQWTVVKNQVIMDQVITDTLLINDKIATKTTTIRQYHIKAADTIYVDNHEIVTFTPSPDFTKTTPKSEATLAPATDNIDVVDSSIFADVEQQITLVEPNGKVLSKPRETTPAENREFAVLPSQETGTSTNDTTLEVIAQTTTTKPATDVKGDFAPFADIPGSSVLERKTLTPEEAYQAVLESVEKTRKFWAEQYKQATSAARSDEVLALAGVALEEAVAVDIAHFWYGTRFDKNGTAEVPGEGEIACSYFITTLLQEAGMNVERVKIAQQGALDIAKIICQPQNLTHCTAPAEVEALMAKKGKGLYIIAFNFHVGFLYNNGYETRLIHASPLPPSTVANIPMKGARSFDYSPFYDIGRLADNKDLIRKWFTGQKLRVNR